MCVEVKGVDAEKLRVHLLDAVRRGPDRDGRDRHPRRVLLPRGRPDRAALRGPAQGDPGAALRLGLKAPHGLRLRCAILGRPRSRRRRARARSGARCPWRARRSRCARRHRGRRSPRRS